MRLRQTGKPGVFLIEAEENDTSEKKQSKVGLRPSEEIPEFDFAVDTSKKASLFKGVAKPRQKDQPTPEKKASLRPSTEPVISRAARFQELVARLQKRYGTTDRKAPTAEHVDRWSIITEDTERLPLCLAEEANWKQGIWISLWPTEKVQKRLARIGGVSAEDIHLTLVYVGRIDKTTHADVATIASVCERVAKAARPFTGQVTGIGRFSTTVKDDLDTVYASFTSPKLDDLRVELLRQLSRAGLSYTRKYGFTPHMTLAKIPQTAVSPLDRLIPFRLRFSWLTLKVGEWRHDYKLGGE